MKANPEQARFANWLAGAIAEARGEPMPAPRKRWSPKDLKALHEELISLFADLRAKLHSMEDVRLLAEFATSARDRARGDKVQAAMYTDVADRLEALAAQLLSTLKAQDEMIAKMPAPPAAE
jgi:hypothetical protein